MLFNAFYSDPHFGHTKLATTKRGFDSVEAMNDTLIERYNAVVDSTDTVLWLGDCFFCSQILAMCVMDQLNGTKVLLRGNHDFKHSTNWYNEVGFALVIDGQVTLPPIGQHRIRACHFPYPNTIHARTGEVDDRYSELRPERQKGEILLHGHTHSTVRWTANQLHVGVDAWELAPVLMSWVEIELGAALEKEGRKL